MAHHRHRLDLAAPPIWTPRMGILASYRQTFVSHLLLSYRLFRIRSIRLCLLVDLQRYILTHHVRPQGTHVSRFGIRTRNNRTWLLELGDCPAIRFGGISRTASGERRRERYVMGYVGDEDDGQYVRPVRELCGQVVVLEGGAYLCGHSHGIVVVWREFRLGHHLWGRLMAIEAGRGI